MAAGAPVIYPPASCFRGHVNVVLGCFRSDVLTVLRAFVCSWRFSFAVSLPAGLWLSACTADSPQPATTTTAVREFKPEPKPEKSERQPEPVIWRTVGSWSGRGNVQTGSFKIGRAHV